MRANFKFCQQSTYFLIQNLLCFPLRCLSIQLQTTYNPPTCFPWHAYTLLVESVYCHWHFVHSTLRLNQERRWAIRATLTAWCLSPLSTRARGFFLPSGLPKIALLGRCPLGLPLGFHPPKFFTISLTTLYFINIANYENSLTELEKLRIHILLLKMSGTSAEQPVW